MLRYIKTISEIEVADYVPIPVHEFPHIADEDAMRKEQQRSGAVAFYVNGLDAYVVVSREAYYRWVLAGLPEGAFVHC